MSYQANCYKCNKVFLKESMKSARRICRECQMARADGEQTESANKRVVVALEEMNKKEILKLLQSMQTRQDELQVKLDELLAKTHELTSINVDDLIADDTFNYRIKSLVREGLGSRLGPMRNSIKKLRSLQENHGYWKQMVRAVIKEELQ